MTMTRLLFSSFILLFGMHMSVVAYTSKKLDFCVSRVIREVFSEEDTLAFIFDKNVEKQLPQSIDKPYVIFTEKNYSTFRLDRIPAYIMQISQLKYVMNTIVFTYRNGLWIEKLSLNARFLIITSEHEISELQHVFELLWNKKIYNTVIVTHDKRNKTVSAHTSYPFHQENFCGQRANVIDSRDCNLDILIKFDKIYRNLNLCTIAYYLESQYLPSIKQNLVPWMLKFLSDNVNGTFIVRYSINDSMESSIQQKYTVALTNFQEYIGLYNRYDFTWTYMWVNMYFMVKSGEAISPIETLFVIFKVEVWIMIGLVFVGTSLTLWFISPLCKNKLKVSEFEKISLDVFSATLWGTFSVLPNGKHARCICMCYLIYHIHIQTGFTCKLVNILTTPRFNPGITNLEELVESNKSIYAHHSYEHMFFWETKNGNIYNHIKNNINYVPKYTFNDTLEIINDDGAILFYGLDVGHFIFMSKLRINKFDANLITGTIRMICALPKGHFFTETVNEFLRRFGASGTLEKRIKKLYEGFDLPSVSYYGSLSLNHLLCTFIFLVLGLTISAMVFVLEMINYLK